MEWVTTRGGGRYGSLGRLRERTGEEMYIQVKVQGCSSVFLKSTVYITLRCFAFYFLCICKNWQTNCIGKYWQVLASINRKMLHHNNVLLPCRNTLLFQQIKLHKGDTYTHSIYKYCYNIHV